MKSKNGFGASAFSYAFHSPYLQLVLNSTAESRLKYEREAYQNLRVWVLPSHWWVGSVASHPCAELSADGNMLGLGGVGTERASHSDAPDLHCASPCIARDQCAGTREKCTHSPYSLLWHNEQGISLPFPCWCLKVASGSEHHAVGCM
jgi:hypothetical protein